MNLPITRHESASESFMVRTLQPTTPAAKHQRPESTHTSDGHRRHDKAKRTMRSQSDATEQRRGKAHGWGD